MHAGLRPELTVTAAQAAAFRLARHRLTHADADAGILDIVRDSGGIQAQVMSAAELSIWARRRDTTRAQIHSALWNTRQIVRTSAMRLTLHLVAADDLPIYIAAMKTTAFRRIEYWLGRMGATPPQVAKMVAAVVEALADGTPRTRQELIASAKKKVGRGMGKWLDHSWSGVRPAVIEGLIVYGPPRGAEATFVRTDRWLGPQQAIDAERAQVLLLRRFLGAFGPATAHDFAKWSGLRTSDAKRLVETAGNDLALVRVDGAPGLIARDDLEALARSELDREAVTLLGAFDSFLLAHATKEHLVDARFYKRVYRPQGWISPVVLRGGEIVGVWFPEGTGKATRLDVQLFRRATPAIRRAIEREGRAMSGFLGTTCTAAFR
jgi:winged helix DNA-binding protein